MIRRQSNFARAWPPVVVACVGIGAAGALSWPFTVDDAYIVARYAQRIAGGQGYGMNAGVPSDGVTGPLWLAPGVLAGALGASPVITAKAVGLCCMLLAVSLVLLRVGSRDGPIAAWLAALATIVQPSLASWGIGGLETGAATLAFTLCALCVTREPAPSPVGAGLAAAALAWLRPELALGVGVLLWSLAPYGARVAARALAWAALGVLSVCVWRLAQFGHVLPLAVAAKLGGVGHGVEYTFTSVVLATSVVGVVACADAWRHGAREARVWSWALAAHLLAVVLAGGDWMPGYRLLVPALPLYCGLLGRGASHWLGEGRRVRALLPWALACALPVVDLATRVPELRNAGRSRDGAGAELAAWLSQHARCVALVDAGYLAFASGVEVVDLAGLTDDVIAQAPGGHLDKRVSEAYLRRRGPDAIVLHSATRPRIEAGGGLSGYDGYPVERRVLAMPWVQQRFDAVRVVDYRPGYHYVVLARRSAGATEASDR